MYRQQFVECNHVSVSVLLIDNAQLVEWQVRSSFSVTYRVQIWVSALMFYLSCVYMQVQSLGLYCLRTFFCIFAHFACTCKCEMLHIHAWRPHALPCKCRTRNLAYACVANYKTCMHTHILYNLWRIYTHVLPQKLMHVHVLFSCVDTRFWRLYDWLGHWRTNVSLWQSRIFFLPDIKSLNMYRIWD